MVYFMRQPKKSGLPGVVDASSERRKPQRGYRRNKLTGPEMRGFTLQHMNKAPHFFLKGEYGWWIHVTDVGDCSRRPRRVLRPRQQGPRQVALPGL